MTVFSINTACAFVHAPSVPDSIVDIVERADYLICNYASHPYWQDHPIYCDAENMQAIAYLTMIASHKASSMALKELLNSSFGDEDNYSSLVYYFDLYLGSPYSPWRNDRLFLEILEAIIASDIDEIYKTVPRSRLKDLLKNQIDTIASDLSLTSACGDTRTLRSYSGRQVVLVFASSECPDCHDGLAMLNSDPGISDAITAGRIVVVIVFIDNKFPDFMEEMDSFDFYRDAHGQIRDDEKYIARILPSVYMLSDSQTVMLREVPLSSFLRSWKNVSDFERTF